MLEQAAEDHRIGDVGHLELVEAKKGGIGGDLFGGAGDRVSGMLPGPVDRLMRLGHEFLEMHAALRREPDLLVEEIEQQRLAAPHPAMEVESPRGRCA